jgi:polyisoprenoid-binding protein YceI
MLHPKIRHLAIIITILASLLSACSPTVSQPAETVIQAAAPAATATTPPVIEAVPTATTAPATAPAAASAPTATTAPASAAAAGSGIKFDLVASKTEASYAVREQLARLTLPSDAIGKTTKVTGSITINPDGTIDPSSKFVVDVASIATDSGMRDGYVRNNILQSSQFPQIVFVPTAASGLASPLPESGSVAFKLTGNLTIRDVTKPITWEVTGEVNAGLATGTATSSFTFEDFNLNQPKVPSVLSVVDKITLTVTIGLQRSGN